ncbi:MAG TPA: class I SAM-dependent methyltransferase [Gemmatimonadaceae bacterium]|nr:class I SAM-dependent methyltransferase [Gemmatimonadaceae bacterium]
MCERSAGFADHFSGIASSYARYRPGYPAALGEWLAARASARRRAWDCGAGNGQVALMLAGHFAHVVASDPSREQLAAAARHPAISYVRATAERVPFAAGSFDLIGVGQALHWFDRPAFFAEAQRVLASGGLIAVWCYGVLSVEPAIDRLLHELYYDVVGSYWPPERALVDRGYADVELPFDEIDAPLLAVEHGWTLSDLLGYIGTWSASMRYRENTGRDAADVIRSRLERAWGDAATRRLVRWPLHIRAGYSARRRSAGPPPV